MHLALNKKNRLHLWINKQVRKEEEDWPTVITCLVKCWIIHDRKTQKNTYFYVSYVYVSYRLAPSARSANRMMTGNESADHWSHGGALRRQKRPGATVFHVALVAPKQQLCSELLWHVDLKDIGKKSKEKNLSARHFEEKSSTASGQIER